MDAPSPAVLVPGEVAFRRVRNGWIVRARACDMFDSESQHIVEMVVEDGDLNDGAARLAWLLFEDYRRTKHRGGLEVRWIPNGTGQPCPRCFRSDGIHAADCPYA